MSKDKSWSAPDTTAFKNITPGDIPKSTYSYKGDSVGKGPGIPPKTGDKVASYKGDSVGGSGNIPPKTGDKVSNYKGDKAVGKKKKYKGDSQV
jgi:hypothetical protein